MKTRSPLVGPVIPEKLTERIEAANHLRSHTALAGAQSHTFYGDRRQPGPRRTLIQVRLLLFGAIQLPKAERHQYGEHRRN